MVSFKENELYCQTCKISQASLQLNMSSCHYYFDHVSTVLTFLSEISIYVYQSKLVSYTHNKQQQQKNTSLTLFAHHEPQGHLWNPYYQTVLLYEQEFHQHNPVKTNYILSSIIFLKIKKLLLHYSLELRQQIYKSSIYYQLANTSGSLLLLQSPQLAVMYIRLLARSNAKGF